MLMRFHSDVVFYGFEYGVQRKCSPLITKLLSLKECFMESHAPLLEFIELGCLGLISLALIRVLYYWVSAYIQSDPILIFA